VVSFMGVTETLNAYPTYIIAYLSLIHCLSPAKSVNWSKRSSGLWSTWVAMLGSILLHPWELERWASASTTNTHLLALLHELRFGA